MSIQLHVELKDLPKEWEQEIRKEQVIRDDCGVYSGHCDYCQGAGCYEEREDLYVKFPESGWMQSYTTRSLMFDNKNVNHQFREELQKAGVPYMRY